RGETRLGMCDHESRRLLRLHQLRELAPVHALELRVEPRPPGDAVDVLDVRRTRQLVELFPGKLERVLDLAEHTRRPGAEIGVARNVTRMEHRPLLREVLGGWQPRRVVPELDHLLFRFRPEHPVYSRSRDNP